MTVQRTDVRIDIQGEQQAAATVASLQRRMDTLSAKAREAQQETTVAESRGARLEALLQRAKQKGMIKRGGFEFGAVEFGAGGFGLNNGWLRGAGGVAGLAFMGVTMTRALVSGASRMANTAADAYQFYRENEKLSAYDLALSAGRETAGGALGMLGVQDASAAVWRVAGALQGRARSAELAGQLSADVWSTLLGNRSELDRALEQQRAAIAATRRAAEDAERAAVSERERARADFLAKSDAEIERRGEGLKAVRPPVRLSRAQARLYKQLEDEGQERVKGVLRGARDAQLAKNEGN